ncbi:MAG TPA: DUF3667 domain-containing protein [Parafilimonas sp.]|nr:DUF3667 domain-containing protein [Parafilimonas sp.]
MENVCKNCGNNFNGAYCNNCGQKSNVSRYTFKHIFEEVIHAFTHADKTLIGFIQKLLINPGKLAFEYIAEGKRKRYFNPFTFFLLIVAFNAFVESEDLELKEKLFHTNNEYGHLFNVYSKVLFLVFIPIFGFITWLYHHKKPRLKFSEYTVYGMILVNAFCIVESIVHIINYIATAVTHHYYGVQNNIVYFMLMGCYFAYADYSFHQSTPNKSLFKNLITGFTFLLMIVAIQIFTVYAFLNNFQGLGRFDTYGIKINY